MSVSVLFSTFICPCSWYWMPLSSVYLILNQIQMLFMMRLPLFYFFHVEGIITANEFYSLLKMHIPNIFISCSREKGHGVGQPACVKDSFSSFIVPHRIRPLWRPSEFLNLLLHCYQNCALESKGSPRNPHNYDVLHLSCLLWWMLSNNVKPFFPAQQDRFSSGV